MLERVLGSPVTERAVAAATSRRLRVLAYHDVPDRAAFAAQLGHLVEHYRPVTGAQVVRALTGAADLPPRAVWITFDDGRRDVVTNALPELRSRALVGTLFVCPGLVEDGAPYWWSVVEAALRDGPVRFGGLEWTDRGLVTHLKTVPDRVRRDVVAGLAPSEPVPAQDRSIGRHELGLWVGAGMEVGNHTWDHPCLDTCTPGEQGDQVRRAHDWLVEVLDDPPSLFAYPNGDRTDDVPPVLAQLGYPMALAFDHRLAGLRTPYAMSRLRIASDAGMDRFRAIVGGAHPLLFHAGTTVRRVRGAVPDRSRAA